MNLCCPPMLLQQIESLKVESALLTYVMLGRSILMSNSNVRGIEKTVASCVILPLMDFTILPMSCQLCGSGAVETARQTEEVRRRGRLFVPKHVLGIREMDVASCIISVPVSRSIDIMQIQLFGSGIVDLAPEAIGVQM